MQSYKTHCEKMNRLASYGLHLAATTLLVSIAACGGGGGDGVVESSSQIQISGVVAKGVAFSGAAVVATNAKGTLGAAVSVASDGTYSLMVPSDTQVPIILTASKALPTGEVESYSTVVADKVNASVTANITPVTNVITALLSSNGNPDQIASQVAGGALITPAMLSLKTQTVQNILKTALDALGVANIDPIKGSFVVNGKAYDKLLESVNVSVIPFGSVSNVEIALRVKAASPSAQPPAVQFVSNQVSPPSLGAVSSSDFVVDDTARRLIQLMADAQACYLLPLSSRVATASVGSSTATGTASDVSAPLCKGIFSRNNPAEYLNSSSRVGRSSVGAGAFSALFIEAATGTKFDNAAYENTLANGDIGFSFRTTLPGGSQTISYNIARLDPVDQKLKFVGDQYVYSGRVIPYTEKREFPTASQSQWNYTSTGYVLGVENVAGQLSKVEITSPAGDTYILAPRGGLGFLAISGKGPSNFLRLRSEFDDPSKVGSVVSRKLPSENSIFAFVDTDYSDVAIAALPAQSVWTFRYFTATNLGATADAVQVYRTRARAMTIAELRSKPFVSASATTLNSWASSGLPGSARLALSTTSPFNIAWTVPTGALPPISTNLFGAYLTGVSSTSADSFNDSFSFAPGSITNAAIACTQLSLGDVHCLNASNGGFRAGSEAIGANLIGADYLGRNLSKYYSFNSLTIAP
jgi:hypothetical protein